MSLITLADYKSLTGASTNDALVTSLIPAVSNQIEIYCDRKFDRAINYEWLKYDQQIILDQWPINNILMIGTAIIVINIADSTNSFTFNIVAGKNTQDGIAGLYITNQFSLASTFYSFDTYTTLATLKAAVELAHAGVTFTYATDPTYNYASMSTKLLRNCTGLTIYGAYNQPQLQYKVEEGMRRWVSIPLNVNYIFQALDYSFESTIFVAYNYGYDITNVPLALKLVTSNIIKDMVNIGATNGGGLYQSESITNYSYTIWDYNQISKLIVDKYSLDLEPWRRKVI